MAVSPELLELAERVRNWGRWGDDDQRGAANLIDAEATRRGAASVETGHRISLAVDLRADGVQVGQPAGRYNPILTPTSLNERDKMSPGVWEGTDDMVTMSTCAGTHIDALSHIGYDNQLWGGRDQRASVTAANGATWCGAEQLPSIATRGVLVDVPRQRGIDELPPGTAVQADDLAAAYERGRIEPAPGDVLVVRTGEMRHYLAGDRRRYAVGVDWQLTGVGLSCVEWHHAHGIAGCFTDTYAYEVMPPESGNWDDLLAVHMLQLRDMGMLQGQNWNLEELADAVAEDDRTGFFLVAAPEPIVGATSAPVHPVAIR